MENISEFFYFPGGPKNKFLPCDKIEIINISQINSTLVHRSNGKNR